jgi:hypothetical protein
LISDPLYSSVILLRVNIYITNEVNICIKINVYNIAKAITAASPTKGNGSITAFPIIETINCDVTE